jgi:membrane-associated phospholipid phosphatase
MDASKSIRYRDPEAQGRLAAASSESHDELWHPLAMALSCLLGAVFVVSWLFQPGRGYWNQFDLTVFRKLNGTLEWGTAWQTVWAVANWRPFDAVVGLILVVTLIIAVRRRFADHPIRAAASFLIFLLTLVTTKEIVSGWVIETVFVYHRGSPTYVLEGTHRLSELVDWIECKDVSPWSFPGDHGFVLLMCAFYATYLGHRRATVAAWLVAVLGVMPRLIGGAHWPTDIIVGSGTMALLASAFLFATPLHSRLLSFVPKGNAKGLWSGFRTASPAPVAPVAPVPVRRAADPPNSAG